MPLALTAKEVEVASAKDPCLTMVRESVTTGDWTRLSGTMYKALSDELWVMGQIVMRGNRIVMPESLWSQVILLAHDGHQGMARTKARLREKVWWPQMDKQVEQYIKTCYPCQLVGPRGKPEPIQSTKLPEGPWMDLAVDIVEVSGNKFLVVVDNYSRWPEVILLKKPDSQHVVAALEAIFLTHGLPLSVRSDNGPPFTSHDFEQFLEHLGIRHLKGVPYWPASNGEVERCNGTILKAFRIASIEGKKWQDELRNYLFQYRVTPHTTTGISPAELLMGRKLRDKLPRVEIPADRASEAQWQQLLRERDALNKLRQREYANKRRAAEPSIISEGDEVLLQKAKENKLSPNFDPTPYTVVQKTGNAVVIEDEYGRTLMRNTAHLKKLLKPDMPTPDVSLKESSPVGENPKTSGSRNSTTPAGDSSPLPTPAPPSQDYQRPVRSRQTPARFKDYVLDS